MRIQDVVKQTNLSKRTIYFYIKEHMITPEVNPENGYYIFSRQDIQRLRMIRLLRQMDFSLADIHAVMSHPQASHLFIQKQILRLKNERNLLEDKIASLQSFKESLPLFVSAESLAAGVARLPVRESEESGNLFCMEEDIKIVCLYLWGEFLQEFPLTEYQQYLWEKLQKKMLQTADENLVLFRNFIYRVPAAQFDLQFRNRYSHIVEVSALSQDNIELYSEKMMERIREFFSAEENVQEWKEQYHDNIRPCTFLFHSDARYLVSELSPLFSSYYENIHICCRIIYNQLHMEQGTDIDAMLSKHLNRYIDIESNYHGELAALALF